MTDEVLITLRKIIRAVDLHSKKLVQKCGLTLPQLLVLKEINKYSDITASDIAMRVSLSNATITDILDRLEKRGFIVKTRSVKDKRRVIISLTPTAQDILEKAPSLLQERFTQKLYALEEWEQTLLLSSLQRIANMMEAEDIDATPILVSGEIAISEKRTNEFLKDIKD